MWAVRRGLTYVLFAALATLAAPAAAQVADGFAEVASDIGVKLYRKDYEGGQPDFVLVVDLENARFESKAGPIASLAEGTGVFGGNNATIARSSLTGFWDSLSASLGARLFAAVNAGFFSTGADPTPLAFALRMGGSPISDGYGSTSEYPGQIRDLNVRNGENQAWIDGFSGGNLTASDVAPELAAGLDVDADKGPTNWVGRTFVGVRDAGGDGTYRTVLVFCSSLATQDWAEGILVGFGAAQQLMMDGGGSSQLVVEGETRVSSTRTIPHVFVAVAGACWLGDDAPCDDGDPCTDDFCDPDVGCVRPANTSPCDDSDPCTLDDACDGAGACAGDTPNPACAPPDPDGGAAEGEAEAESEGEVGPGVPDGGDGGAMANEGGTMANERGNLSGGCGCRLAAVPSTLRLSACAFASVLLAFALLARRMTRGYGSRRTLPHAVSPSTSVRATEEAA